MKKHGSDGARSPRDGEDPWARANALLAFGSHHRSLLRPLFHGEFDAYPKFAVEASGCRVIDATGRTFIDWVSGTGSAILGFRHPAVVKAIHDQLAAGPTLSLYHPVEVEVAEALVEMVPCAEMVAFGKNGSDALTAAVRVARAHTGRAAILHHGYHGFHDWFACRLHANPGLPHACAEHLHSFPYNDLPALEELFRKFRGSVAAIVMEPLNVAEPDRGYLDRVRALAHAHGALLVFDEVWTGFRVAKGGAQERYGVVPDLACYGKALAGGMPLSALVGARRYMRLVPSVAYGMTYRDETLSLAACRAVLNVIRTEPVTDRIHAVDAKIRAEFPRLCREARIRCAIVGMKGRLMIEFADQGGFDRDRLLALFLRECALRGVLTSHLVVPNYAHDDEAVRRTLEVFAESIAVVAAHVHGTRGAAEPSPIHLTRGHVDVVKVQDGGQLEVHGWLLVDDAPADRVELVAADGAVVAAESALRPDVIAELSLPASAIACGFAASLPAETFARDGEWNFEIRALRGGTAVFRCPVVHRLGWRRPVLSGTAWLTFGT